MTSLDLGLGLSRGGGLSAPVSGLQLLQSANFWYDTKSISATTQQTLANRGTGAAVTAQRGSAAGSDTNDPGFLTHIGQDYVYLSGTAGNSITFPRPYATTHFTITKTDDTTVTGTTTADPVVIGGTAHSGNVKSVVLRETDAGGAIGETLNPSTLAGWTVNRAPASFIYTTNHVTRPIANFDRANDYLQLPTEATPQAVGTAATCILLLTKMHILSGAGDRRVFSSETNYSKGMALYRTTASPYWKGTFGNASSSRYADPAGPIGPGLVVVGLVMSGGSVKFYDRVNGLGTGVNSSDMPSIPHTSPRIGGLAFTTTSLSSFGEEWLSCLVFTDSAPTLTELNLMADTLIAGDYT